MNEMQTFNYGDIPVRTVIRDNEPWWVLSDVCRVLALSNSRRVAERLDADEKDVTQGDTPGGRQTMTIISESGLYKVILRSDKPEAKKFTRWVTHEVLPAIRKTGVYAPASTSEPTVQMRALTTDDYIVAARLSSECRNERLPYVLGFLQRGGFDIPKVEAASTPKRITYVEKISGFQMLDLEDFL